MAVFELGGRIKDPNATIAYGIDWATDGWLDAGETITASSWVADAGLTASAPSFTGTTTAVTLSGGTVGVFYTVTNHVSTSAGRIDDRSFTIKVQQR